MPASSCAVTQPHRPPAKTRDTGYWVLGVGTWCVLALGAFVSAIGSSNTRRALFLCACVGIFALDICPAQRLALQAGVRQRERVTRCDTRHEGMHPTATLDLFRAKNSAGEYLVPSSKHCGPVWRQAQHTDAIGLSSAAVVENYYVLCSAPRLLPYAMRSCASSACAARP
jgi:hypothetical protein